MKKISINSYLDSLEVPNRNKIMMTYGQTLFDVFYSTYYHDFIKSYFTSYHNGLSMRSLTLANHIYTFYHQKPDPVDGTAFTFRAMGDDNKIKKIPYRTPRHQVNQKIVESVQGEKDIVLSFDCNPEFGSKHCAEYPGLKQRIINVLQREKLLDPKYCADMPTIFDFKLHRDNPEASELLIVDSIF